MRGCCAGEGKSGRKPLETNGERRGARNKKRTTLLAAALLAALFELTAAAAEKNGGAAAEIEKNAGMFDTVLTDWAE